MAKGTDGKAAPDGKVILKTDCSIDLKSYEVAVGKTRVITAEFRNVLKADGTKHSPTVKLANTTANMEKRQGVTKFQIAAGEKVQIKTIGKMSKVVVTVASATVADADASGTFADEGVFKLGIMLSTLVALLF